MTGITAGRATVTKVVYHSFRLSCSTESAFEMFTSNKHLQAWLTVIADVVPAVGGKYELFWDRENMEENSTKGCTITAMQPAAFISFDWKGPEQFKHFMNRDPLTHVTVFFLPAEDETDVHLIHSGWGSSRAWQEARLWFDKAWGRAFERLKKYVGAIPAHN